MKKIILPSILYLLVITGACKKQANNAATGTTGANTSNTTTSYNGTLEASKSIFSLSPSLVDSSYSCNAYLYNTPQSVQLGSYIPQYLVNAGNVLMDTVKTQHQPNNSYADTTGGLNLANMARWSVSGSSAVPQFTYSYTPVWPAYSHYSQLPDTIYLGQNCTLELSGMSNAANVIIELFNPNTGASQGTNVNSIAANTNYTFTSSSLSGFSSGQSAYLSVTLFNTASLQTFSSKKYLFYNRFSYIKTIYFK